jgi:hypothetical protein
VNLCLSSGASPRYRNDIRRALSMPSGTQLQFRYDRKWISHSILASIDAGDAGIGETVIIAYLDQSNPLVQTSIVPCRRGVLRKVEALGSTVTLEIAVDSFAYASDLRSLNAELKSADAAVGVPEFDAGQIRGWYWLRLGGQPLSLSFSTDLRSWECTVDQLVRHKEFSTETLFYHVLGLFTSAGEQLPFEKGVCSVSANHSYDFRLYHYHPDSAENFKIKLAAADNELVGFAWSPEVTIDSRYGAQSVRIITREPTRKASTAIALLRQEVDKWVLEFDLLIQVSPSLARRILLALLLAAGIMIPPITIVWQNPALGMVQRTVVTMVSVLTGLVTGFATVFGLKRSL